MSRDINPFGVRMPPELKEQLEREARLNGRSLNLEIVDRLRRSLERQEEITIKGYSVGGLTPPDYASQPNVISDTERQLLSIFRRMPVEKQLAMLSLFK